MRKMSISSLSNREVCLLLCVNARINYVRGWIPRSSRRDAVEGEKRFPSRHMKFNNNSICCYLSLARHSPKVFNVFVVHIYVPFCCLCCHSAGGCWRLVGPRFIYANIMCVFHYVATPSHWVFFSRYCLRFTLYLPPPKTMMSANL